MKMLPLGSFFAFTPLSYKLEESLTGQKPCAEMNTVLNKKFRR